jgi:hypothetical protein
MFGADCMGKKPTGHYVFVQVTAGQNSQVTKRRRKLEEIPWLDSDDVQILQLISTEDPANARKKLWFFRVHHYYHNSIGWQTARKAVPVPSEWFKAYKNATHETR